MDDWTRSELKRIGEKALTYIRTHGTHIPEKRDFKLTSTGAVILKEKNNDR